MTDRKCRCLPWCGHYLRVNNTTGWSGYCAPKRAAAGERFTAGRCGGLGCRAPLRTGNTSGVCAKCRSKHGTAERALAIGRGEPPSVIAWSGRSTFTGREVMLVLTGLDGKSANDKTGPMVQASVIQAEGNVSKHRGTERERDVCGDCPASKVAGGDWCYAVTMAWMLGQHAAKYPVVTLERAAEMVRGKAVRVGAYGDPAAIPFTVWEQLVGGALSATGYTHAWRTCDPSFRSLVMASTESCEETIEAQALGWRAFRIAEADARLIQSEVRCPNETRGRLCIDCRLCAGAKLKAKSIVITAHGTHAGRFLNRAERKRQEEEMASASERVLGMLRKAKKPLTRREFVEKIDEHSASNVDTSIGRLVRLGTVVKEGEAGAYTYRLAEAAFDEQEPAVVVPPVPVGKAAEFAAHMNSDAAVSAVTSKALRGPRQDVSLEAEAAPLEGRVAEFREALRGLPLGELAAGVDAMAEVVEERIVVLDHALEDMGAEREQLLALRLRLSGGGAGTTAERSAA